jgi:zinc transport system permease protein
MLAIFQYDFMLRAFAAGTIIGIIAPLIGSFLVARRYSLIADSLSHVALAGVAIGLLTGIYPIYSAIAVAVIVALLIEHLRSSKQISGEMALAIFLSGGLAIAITLISLGTGFNVDLFSYLFGSITTVTTTDIWTISILGLATLLIIILLYKELFFISFDEESARVSGLPTKTINNILIILAAITVGLAMRIVGILLIGALMVIPVVTAIQIARSFKQSLVLASILGLLSVILGLFAAYYLNLPAGGAIVILALIFLLLAIMVRKR